MDSETPFDVLAVCLAPTLQKTLVFDDFRPGGVNRARESYLDASGKGINAARVVSQSGGTALHLTHSGGAQAALFERLCAQDGLRVEAIHCAAEIRVCVTIIDLGKGEISELVEECPPVPPTTWRLLKEKFLHRVDGAKTVLISGKPAAGYPENAIPELARLATQAGKALVLDVRGKDLAGALQFSPSVCKPNATELRDSYAAFGIPAGTVTEEAAAALSAKTGSAFLVTDGPNPAVLAIGGKSERIAIPRIEALNPIGSGDACAAGIALGLARGMGIAEACRWGLELGSLNATTLRPGRIRP